MKLPSDTTLPFFAYGIFRPGQLAYFQLSKFVDLSRSATIKGGLRLRDGLPILDRTIRGEVDGSLLAFRPQDSGNAYDRISAMEPEKHYCWQKTRVEGVFANVLFGESPQKGSVDCEEGEWNGWNDPLFTAALEVVEEELNWHQGFEWDLKPLFRLQMAYLLLWSSIERYVSLRYHLGDKATQKVKQLAEEQAFVDGLRQHVHTRHTLGRANQPTKKVTLDPDSPVKSVMFYYQIRSNIVHRGKGVVRDHRVLKDALTQLLPIFRAVLKAAEEDARSTDREMESTPTATLERSSNGVLPIFQFLPVPNAVDVLFDL